MEIIYNFVPEKKMEPKKDNKFVKILKNLWNNWILRSIMLLAIAILVIIFAVVPIARKNIKIVRESRADYIELVNYAHSDFYSNEYKVIEKSEYMIELLPYGETDDYNNYSVEPGERLIKQTWYNNKRTKVEHVEYYILYAQQR